MAAITGIALLAWPAYEFLYGPQHYSGPLYSSNIADLSSTLGGAVLPGQRTAPVHYVAGGNTAYLGVTLIVLVLAALVYRRSDRRLHWAAGMAGASFVLSLGDKLHAGTAGTGVPMPAWLLQRVPVLQDILPYRFASFTALFAGLALAITLDGVRAERGEPRVRAALEVCGLAVLALAPLVIVAPGPYAVAPQPAPAALDSAAIRSLPADAVVIEYPLPDDFHAQAMVWQAERAMPYRLVGGYELVPGYDGKPTGITPTDPIGLVMVNAELGTLHQVPSRLLKSAVHDEMRRLGVGVVLVLAGHPQSADVLAYLAASIGVPPTPIPGGWIWRTGGRGSETG